MRFAFVVLYLMACALPLYAQDETADPIVVPFASIPPFMLLEEDGTRSGFIVELSELIGAEIGLPVSYLDVANSREFVAAQASGQSHMVAGILQLPPLAATNVFSTTVAVDTLRPAVSIEDHARFEEDGLSGVRIGVVPPAAGSDSEILNDNIRVEFDSPEGALMGLLDGSLEAVLLPPPVVYGIARTAELDGRIVFLGDPLQESSRHIALHQSRADLLEPINEALARFEANGQLAALRYKYNLVVPDPPPAVLRVPIAHSPPYGIISDDGEFSGYAADLFAAIATRANLVFEFEQVTLDAYFEAAATAGADVIPFILGSEEIGQVLDFTNPIDSAPLDILVRSDDTRFESWEDLVDAHVGTFPDTPGVLRSRGFVARAITPYPTVDEIVGALNSGEIDAIMDITYGLEAEGITAQFRSIGSPAFEVENVIGLRPGLGIVRERLNAVIPGYLVSDGYAELRTRYFGEPVFWTSTRIAFSLAALAAVFIALLSFSIWQALRQRQQKIDQQAQDLAREQSHSAQLNELVAELERSNRDLDDFAYIASHDLKEPLRGIGINANFLMREALPDKAAKRAQRMGELATRMDQLVSELLAFSRLGRRQVQKGSVEPHSIIAEIHDDLAEWLEERNGEIVEISALPTLRAERLDLKTVLQNLIVNGIKFNDSDHPCVRIGFQPDIELRGRTLKNVVFVEDNGIGIAEQNHDKVFRIFSRLNKASEYEGTGTGSGLAFVRRIVEDHGGVVDFRSELGAGTTFYVTFPLAEGG